MTSSETEERLEIDATLIGADVRNRHFRLRRFGLPDIKGTFELGAIDDAHAVKLPRRYLVVLRKTTQLHYATGKETVRYHLLSLTEAPE